MDKKVEVILSGNSAKLINALKDGGRNIEAFGSKTVSVLSRANKSIAAFSDKYIGAMAKIGIGVGGIALAKNVMEFDSELGKFGRNAGMNQFQVAKLKKEILDLSQTVPLSKSALLEMTKDLEGTGIAMETVSKILPEIAKGAVANGVDAKVYGDTIGELLDKYKVAAADLPELQDKINVALKLDDVKTDKAGFLNSLKTLTPIMQDMKSSGMGNVSMLLAVQAQLTKYMGSAGDAASATGAIFNGLMRIQKNTGMLRNLQSHGINFFNKDGSIKPIRELIMELDKFAKVAEKHKGVETESALLFARPEAVKGVRRIVGGLEDVAKNEEQLRNSSGAMGKDFQAAMQENAHKLELFQNQLDAFNTEHMSRLLNHLSTVLDYLNKHPLISKGLMYGLIGAGGLVMLSKVIEGVRTINGLFGKGKGGGGGLPVYVTNMSGGGIGSGYSYDPLMGGGGGTGGIFKDRIGAGAWRNWGNQFGVGTQAALLIGAATFGWEIGKGIAKLLGIENGEGGAAFYDWTHKDEARNNATQDALWVKYAEAKKAGNREQMKSLLNQIKIIVNVDKNGNGSAETEDPNTSIDINRGSQLD